jgi:hypothetical protein
MVRWEKKKKKGERETVRVATRGFFGRRARHKHTHTLSVSLSPSWMVKDDKFRLPYSFILFYFILFFRIFLSYNIIIGWDGLVSTFFIWALLSCWPRFFLKIFFLFFLTGPGRLQLGRHRMSEYRAAEFLFWKKKFCFLDPRSTCPFEILF